MGTTVMALLSNLIIISSIIGSVSTEPKPTSQSVCQNEEFTAHCNENEVVVMTTAKYGRMDLSSCIQRDYGYIGCSVDVLTDADKFCSGKRSCKIPIPNTAFDLTAENHKVCPTDLKSYLHADYKCMPVFHRSIRRCPPSNIVTLPSQEGHLASILTEETNIGSASCPYVIEAPRGSVIQFSIMDFTILTEKTDICYAYATFKEENPYKRSTVCSKDTRERVLQITQSNKVQIRIMPTGARKHRFVLKYKVECATPATNSITWFDRNGNTGTFGCKNSAETWQVTCVDYAWKGRISNCSSTIPAIDNLTERKEKTKAMSHRMSLILVTTIALALGATILAVGIFVLKWKRNRRSPYEDVYPKQGETKLGQTQSHDQYGNPSMPQMTHSIHDYGYGKENEYAYISDFPPSMYDQGPGRSIEDRHLELYQARMCRNPYGTYAHGQHQVDSVPLKTPKPPTVPICLPTYYDLDQDGRKKARTSGPNSSSNFNKQQQSVVMPPPANELPTPTPSAYDHLINAGCTSNHKSV